MAVTGGNGRYGREVVRHLLNRVQPESIIASVRDPAQASRLAERGVQVRHGDFDDPASLSEAFAGARKVLIVSTDLLFADRVRQHRNAVDAAQRAGAEHIFYTSAFRAELSSEHSRLKEDHVATERYILATGLAYTFLRNNKYTENYNYRVAEYAESGIIKHASGQGRVSMAAISDYAEAAAIMISGSGHECASYELSGSRAVSMGDYARAVSEVTGRDVRDQQISDDELLDELLASGHPPEHAHAKVQDAIEIRTGGGLDMVSPVLAETLGHPLTPLTDVIARALGLATDR